MERALMFQYTPSETQQPSIKIPVIMSTIVSLSDSPGKSSRQSRPFGRGLQANRNLNATLSQFLVCRQFGS
jgi:hypothetical protein